jgi:multidrug efflux pump subunit AcrA (membrane-fusion protein)
VKYDTIVELPADKGLKPGMSAEVEVELARYEDVLTIPVAAIVENEEGDFCWVKTIDGAQRRKLQLGDSNDVFVVVKAGVREGDEVVLNPTAYLDDAQVAAMKTPAITEPEEQDAVPLQGSAADSTSP